MKRTRGSGSAVSLYLPADVKYLHDLAVQDPNLTASEIYANALRSILGDKEAKHPLELMQESQELEINNLNAMLEQATKRLEATQSRLPNEIAKATWLRHNLGESHLKTMEHLRVMLFFNANVANTNGIKIPSTPRACLDLYKEYISRYEATKKGPEHTKEFTLLVDRHPSNLKQSHVKCINADNLEIECCIKIPGQDGRYEYIQSDRGTELGDDLIYRCSSCWTERKLAHKGKDTEGKKIAKLLPYWKTEILSDEEMVLIGKRNDINADVGLLQHQKNTVLGDELVKLQALAEDSFDVEHTDKASRIEELMNLAKAKFEYDSKTNERIPQWKGHKNWMGAVAYSKNMRKMENQYPENYAEFMILKAELSELNKFKVQFLNERKKNLILESQNYIIQIKDHPITNNSQMGMPDLLHEIVD
tara:strand:- start:590 stop:1849 length:1260 start_codon:yes stop_codon:yes gene_type:complete